MIGIHDVWRQFDARLLIEEHIIVEEYTRTLVTLIRTMQPRLNGLMLMTPYTLLHSRPTYRFRIFVRPPYGFLLVDSDPAIEKP